MIAPERDWGKGHVAFAGCQNPCGREMWLSAELKVGEEMLLLAWQGSFPITARTKTLRCVLGREGSCAKLQLPSSSGFGCSALLGSTKFMASSSQTQPHGHNLTWVTATEETPYIWLLVSVFASHPVQLCVLPHNFTFLLQTRSSLSIPVQKQTAWAWIWRGNIVANGDFIHH